jgi:acetaldehyde dehydrogenase
MMRDTIFCSLPLHTDTAAVTRSIHEMVANVQTYVPGYRLTAEPQFDLDATGGRVAIFVEVEGAGDYLPPYAGNLDIMTAAATKVGEAIAKSMSTGC